MGQLQQAIMTQMDHHDKSARPDTPPSMKMDSTDANSVETSSTRRSTMFGGKKIVGDLFGTHSNFDSLGYRSRVEMMMKMQQDAKHNRSNSMATEILASSQQSVVSVEFYSDSESENEITSALSQKQQLAMTMRNWAASGKNDDKLINEGAISTLITLASVDDMIVRKSCASAFCYLSSRKENRSQLIKLGAVVGVITIAMSVRSWKTAKSCAMCLCNLSMEPGGEGIMAREGAILAISILMGVKNQRLLPICVHTLYNMTCVDQHFKGMDRIAKAMLNVPMTGFDHTHFLIKALVNCSRYSWMRNRMIEDGSITTFHALVPQIPKRSNSREYVLHMLICLAYLGESSTQCRTDMLQRGAVELLSNLAAYCDDDELRYYMVKIVHNLLEIVRMMNMTLYETCVNVVVEMLQSIDDDESTIQYAGSCLLTFTKDHMRAVPYLNDLVLDCMSQLLNSTDPLTQYFGLTCSGNIFEKNTW